LTNEFTKERTGTGTYEWADATYNIQKGCSHGCLYCYACESALRYKRINSRQEWLTENIDYKAVNKKWHSDNKVIMFPTTHDITPNNIEACITALKNILQSRNKVLIVSKPHLSCIQKLCAELEPWKEQILFRFTIGSFDTGVCSFWEPGAPDPWERYHALEYAYRQGYQTSVSIEPMLEGVHEALVTFGMAKSYVTETVWIGKMNKMRTRVDISNPDNEFMVKDLEHQQRNEEIIWLVNRLKDEPKVRWKDSIKKVIMSASENPAS
jgi:DNA repair photolyase